MQKCFMHVSNSFLNIKVKRMKKKSVKPFGLLRLLGHSRLISQDGLCRELRHGSADLVEFP